MKLKLVLLTVFIVMSVGCDNLKKVPEMNPAEKELLTYAKDNFEPLPYHIIDKWTHADQIALGKKLYFETALSINNKISCNSCHRLDNFGVDSEPTSPGHEGKRGDRNSPTVLNAAIHIAQFWDGRAKDVEEQAIGPITNPIEMGMGSDVDALKKIDTKEYRQLFAKAFPNQKEPFTYKNIGMAIGAFERTLLTQSRFDDYLRGNITAISYDEKIGLKRFMDKGCIACHAGVGVGGDTYMKLGLEVPYPTEDLGRFNVTGEEDDKHVFKVPSLRNVVMTAPYLHDGSIKTIEQMIRLMGKHQLGENLSNDDVFYIKSFLGSLTAR